MPVELNQFDLKRAYEQMKSDARKKCSAELEGT